MPPTAACSPNIPRERRLYLPSAAIPDLVKEAFISAEDKNFYTHHGVDPEGIVRAGIVSCRAPARSGRLDHHPAGGEELPPELGPHLRAQDPRDPAEPAHRSRPIRRTRSSSSTSTRSISGSRNYGVAAAALNYFDKSVHELTIAEVAYLAALPKEPSPLNPFRNHDRAIERRNYVIGRMEEDGYITAEQARAGAGRTARGQSARSDPQFDRRRLLRRGGAARTVGALWRTEALRRRPVRPHDARPENAADGAQGAGRRPRAL